MKYPAKKRAFRNAAALLLAVVLLIADSIALDTSDGAAVSAMPESTKLYCYNTSPYAAVYVTTNPTEVHTTYRVYSDASCTKLLGEADTGEGVYCCAVTLSRRFTRATQLYVTRQAEGEKESRGTVCTLKINNPEISLKLWLIDETKAIPTTNSGTDSPNFFPSSSMAKELKAGSFYQAEVLLSGFSAIDTVLIPLRYDTELLEPAAVYSSGSGLKVKASTSLSSAKSGTTVQLPSADSMGYGLLPGINFQSWTNDASSYSPYFTYSSAGTYTYINTTTGLFKLQGSVHTWDSAAPFGMGDNDSQFMRFYFKALKDVTFSTLPVWFATEEDCPEEWRDSDSLRVTYYDTASPNGAKAALRGVNVMSPPPTLSTADSGAALAVRLPASQLSGLPDTYYNAVTTAAALGEDQVKVYNYTNYSQYQEAVSLTLDGSQGLNDCLIVQSSYALSPEDTVKVYLSAAGNDSCIGSGIVDNEGGVKVDLGMRNLSPDGGTVYLSVVHKNQESTNRLPVPYSKEAERNVSFQIYRSGWDKGHLSQQYDADQAPGALSGENKVQVGEHLQLRIYFNNFNDLMSYCFNIRYDPDFVQAADTDYGVLTTGAVSEADYKEGASCFSVGADLANVTLAEQMIYQAYLDKDQSEIDSLCRQLNIDADTFSQIAADVEVKYAVGVTEDGADALPWTGGLLFTGERTDNSAYPYVDNQKGSVRFVSAALKKSAVSLDRRGDGYHFLSVNFIATANGDPGFRLTRAGDPGDVSSVSQGQKITVLSSEPGVSLKVRDAWSVHPMGDQVEMELFGGNALQEDGDSQAVYLYSGEAYRDPGFVVRRADGSKVDCSEIRRYYDKAGEETELPAYRADEALMDFTIPENGYSAEYRLTYEYVAREGGTPVQMTRHIYIIFKRGDVNRDGTVDLFDEQALADHLNGIVTLDLTDELYKWKTVDAAGDKTAIDKGDRGALRRYSLGLGVIGQDYTMPVR